MRTAAREGFILLALLCPLALFTACAQKKEPMSAGPSIVAGGDCLLDRKGLRSGLAGRQDAASIPRGDRDRRWDTIAAAARNSGSFIFNLETAVGRGGRARKKPFVFHADEETLAPLCALPQPVAALANNHSMDFGPEGLLEGIGCLDRAGIGHAGAARTLALAASPCILRLDGPAGALRLSVLSFGFDADAGSYNEKQGACIAPLNLDLMRRSIRSARASSNEVLVMLHWGTEYSRYYDERQRYIAEELVRAGARLIVGTGPHVLQGLEIYRDSLICYSLGNLVFDDTESEETRTTVLVRACFPGDRRERKKAVFEIAPLRTSAARDGPLVPSAKEAGSVIGRLARLSAPGLKIRSRGRDAEGILWYSIE